MWKIAMSLVIAIAVLVALNPTQVKANDCPDGFTPYKFSHIIWQRFIYNNCAFQYEVCYRDVNGPYGPIKEFIIHTITLLGGENCNMSEQDFLAHYDSIMHKAVTGLAYYEFYHLKPNFP